MRCKFTQRGVKYTRKCVNSLHACEFTRYAMASTQLRYLCCANLPRYGVLFMCKERRNCTVVDASVLGYISGL